jgi:glutathione S-transferase
LKKHYIPTIESFMIKLHGRLRSNYYNAVKAVLIEKQIPFEEVIEPAPPTAEFLKLSPMAKIPCLNTDAGPITETTAIMEYIEETHSQHPLSPADPYDRAKLKELCKSMELYVEWLARRGYGALRGEDVDEADSKAIRDGMPKAAAAVSQLTTFAPWIGGAELTYADFFCYYMLIYARLSTKLHAEFDLLAAIPGAQDWVEAVAALPTMQRVIAEAKAS